MEGSDDAVEAIKALNEAGRSAFITLGSGGRDGDCVLAKFRTRQEASAFYKALIQCGETARYIAAHESEGTAQ